MNCKVENGRLILNIDGVKYSFEAHGEEPRSSLLNLGISAGGKHWSDRNPENRLEKHTSIQDVVLGSDMVAWYTQEFIPDGEDYKISKNAKLYVGFLKTGEQKLIYKGECYGDLCFDKGDLYFNTGNKVAVVDTMSGEVTILFKHSSIKKNYIRLHITDKRIFYIHWTHSEYYFMWYDRASCEILNPHINLGFFSFLDNETVIYQALYHTWILNVETMKKKRFFSEKQRTSILKTVCDYFEIPVDEYSDDLRVSLVYHENGRLYFNAESIYNSLTVKYNHEANVSESFERNLPWSFIAEFSCEEDGSDICIKIDKSKFIVREYDDGKKSLRFEVTSHSQNSI